MTELVYLESLNGLLITLIEWKPPAWLHGYDNDISLVAGVLNPNLGNYTGFSYSYTSKRNVYWRIWSLATHMHILPLWIIGNFAIWFKDLFRLDVVSVCV